MAPKAKALNGKAPAPQQTQQQSPPQQKQPQAQPKQQAQPQPKQQPASKAAAEAPGAPAKPSSKAQPKQQTQAQAKQPPSKAAEPMTTKAAQPKQQAAPAKAEAAAPKAASKAQPKQQPQQAQPKQPTSKAAQAKPAAAAPAPVEPVVTDDGFGEVARRKKRRNNKKAPEFAEDPAEMSAPEDRHEENCSEEVMSMMAMEKSRLEVSLKATTDSLRKEIEAIPEVTEGGSVIDVAQQKKAIDKMLQEIEKALLANKVARPKKTNTRLIMQQMEEFQKCKTSASSNIDEEARREMLKDAEDTLKAVMSWEAYKDFQGQLNELKAECERKLKSNDDLNLKVRSGNNQRRMVQRVAAVKGVEGLDAKDVVSTPLDLDAQVAALPWLVKRFEKSHGVVIDRLEKQGSKLVARGVKTDVDAVVAALKAVDCSTNKALSVTDRQAAQVMGAQQSNARKIEEMFKGVYLHSEQNKVTVFGPKAQVPLCVNHLETIIQETAAPPQPQTAVKEMTIDKDRARALIGLNGRKVKDLETETGTSIKVGKPAAEESDTVPVKISGEKSKVANAGQKVESFLRSLEGQLIPATLEVINRLYDTGKSKGSGKGGKGSKNWSRTEYSPSEAASKFAALRETPGLTVTRKADGIHLLGTRDVVNKSKETLEDCLKEASNTPLVITLNFPQGRLWTSERCASTSASSGAQVKVVKRVREVVLEVSGTQEQKDAAEAAINEVHEAHQEVLTLPVTIDTRYLTGRPHGERIQEIERSCDVAITMDKRNQAVKIHGSKESTEQAKELVEKLLAEVPAEETAVTAEAEQPSQAAPSNGNKHESTARDRDRDRGRETKSKGESKGGKDEGAAAASASSSSHANQWAKQQQAKVEKTFVAADGDFPTLGGPPGEGGKAPQRPMGAWASS